MDRRDALKKLGMGGATVVGATMIVSSPAFANFGSTASQPGATAPTVTLAKSNANVASGTATFLPRTCPSESPTFARIDFALEAVTLNGGSITGAQAPYQPGLNTGNPDNVTRLFTVNWGATKDVTIRVSVRYVCNAIGGGVAWTCYSGNYQFTAANNGDVTADANNPSTQPELAACDSPAPTL